jgi:hypothetical protein
MLRAGLVVRGFVLLLPMAAALGFAQDPVRSPSGGLTDVVSGPASKSITYWALPTLCGLLSLGLGFWFHERRVATGIRLFPARRGAWFYWRHTVVAHCLLMVVPTVLFVYWRWFASAATRSAYERYGSNAFMVTLVWSVLPVLVAMALTHRRSR